MKELLAYIIVFCFSAIALLIISYYAYHIFPKFYVVIIVMVIINIIYVLFTVKRSFSNKRQKP